jgi:phosphatidate phosphatase APP1
MIVLFPTYGRRVPGTNRWRATVAGMVSRPLPEKSRRRALAVTVLRRLLDLEERDLESDVFRRRAEAFFFERLAGRDVEIAIRGWPIVRGQTDKIGHFHAAIELEVPEGAGQAIDFAATVGLADGESAGPAGGEDGPRPLTAVGGIHLVADSGLSVISDIDDTVKVTNVANRRELLRNTLLREFTAVPGMPDVYRRWQAEGTAFHYVSASPWQLSRCLCCFLDEAGLPAGSMHLKLFRLKDSTPLGRLPSRKRSKRRVIEQIMADFPGRRFLLVGDSGERDPEVYAAVARRRPAQVAGIAIRLVESKASPRKQRERLDRLARRLPETAFQVFTEAAELAEAWPCPPAIAAHGK